MRLECDGATVIMTFIFFQIKKKHKAPTVTCHTCPARARVALHLCLSGCENPGIDFLISVITLGAHSTGEDKNMRTARRL